MRTYKVYANETIELHCVHGEIYPFLKMERTARLMTIENLTGDKNYYKPNGRINPNSVECKLAYMEVLR